MKSAAGVLLQADNTVVAIVGDYGKVKDQLAGFKDIQFFDAEGKAVAAPQ